MKLSFSTIGCPGWTFNEIVSGAKDLGFEGVEIRGIEKEIYAPKCRDFCDDKINETKELLGDKLEISCFSTDICLGNKDKEEKNIEECVGYLLLAKKLGVKSIRTMISNKPEPTETDVDYAVGLYKKLCRIASEIAPATSLLVETNGVLADSVSMARFMENTGCDNGGVLWDIHHPIRFYGESVEKTYKNIGKYIKHVHVKDSKLVDSKVVYRMMGYGDMPIPEALKLLIDYGYTGYVSLEWIKRWLPEMQEPGIVFSQYISYMNFLIDVL